MSEENSGELFSLRVELGDSQEQVKESQVELLEWKGKVIELERLNVSLQARIDRIPEYGGSIVTQAWLDSMIADKRTAEAEVKRLDAGWHKANGRVLETGLTHKAEMVKLEADVAKHKSVSEWNEEAAEAHKESSVGLDRVSTLLRDHGVFTGDDADDVKKVLTRVAKLEKALNAINVIRNSIIGAQCMRWTEHMYPLVAILNEAGFEGDSYNVARKHVGTLIERAHVAEMKVGKLEAINAEWVDLNDLSVAGMKAGQDSVEAFVYRMIEREGENHIRFHADSESPEHYDVDRNLEQWAKAQEITKQLLHMEAKG